MKPNPDNRADNVARIQNNIDMTIDNIHRANEMISKTSDEKMKQALNDKNERRMEALNDMRHEIKGRSKCCKKQRGSVSLLYKKKKTCRNYKSGRFSHVQLLSK